MYALNFTGHGIRGYGVEHIEFFDTLMDAEKAKNEWECRADTIGGTAEFMQAIEVNKICTYSYQKLRQLEIKHGE